VGCGRCDSRKGVILVGALWVMMFLAMVVLSFATSQTVELRAAGAFADRLQGRHLARSGVEDALACLMADETDYDGPDEEWRRNPERFERVPLGEGFYSLIYNNVDENAELTFGMDDENGKVNLNIAPKEVLEDLPGMSEALAEALIDWRDEDDETTGDGGAEDEYYLRLDPPYYAKNGPLDTVEELLLIKGFTTAKVFGEDANRNGVLDACEDDGDRSYPPDDQDGVLDGGLVDYVTVYSYERNQTLEGEKRVNINEAKEPQLQNRLGHLLPPPKIKWIAEYRKAEIAGNPLFPDKKYMTPANVVAFMPVPGVAGEPLTFDEYRLIEDLVTVSSEDRIEGKINVNTARKAVLKVLPQLSDEEADAIVSERKKEETDLSSPTWVFDVLEGTPTEKLAKYQALEPFLCVRSWQFTLQSVGVVPGRGATSRLHVVVDRAAQPPKFLYWRDVSGLGAAFAPPSREAWLNEAGDGY